MLELSSSLVRRWGAGISRISGTRGGGRLTERPLPIGPRSPKQPLPIRPPAPLPPACHDRTRSPHPPRTIGTKSRGTRRARGLPDVARAAPYQRRRRAQRAPSGQCPQGQQRALDSQAFAPTPIAALADPDACPTAWPLLRRLWRGLAAHPCELQSAMRLGKFTLGDWRARMLGRNGWAHA